MLDINCEFGADMVIIKKLKFSLCMLCVGNQDHEESDIK